jgi:hypothetical protein
MSLRGAQQRALDVIENALETSAPRLTAMFAMFTRLAADEEPVSAEQLPSSRRDFLQSRLLLMLPVAALIVLVVGLAVGFSAGRASACVPAGHARTTVTMSCEIQARK